MNRPRLEILTRHLPDREDLLKQLRLSLNFWKPVPGGGKDWIHTILFDPDYAGVPASHLRLRSVEPYGQFVWVLDDDDLCLDPTLLIDLEPEHDLYVYRAHYEEFDDVFPPPSQWDARCVEHGFSSPINFIVRRDLWMKTREAWGDCYDGDFDFLATVLECATNPLWIDRVIAVVSEPRSRPSMAPIDPDRVLR